MTHMDGNKIAAEMQEVLINQNGFLSTLIEKILQKAIEVEFEKFIGAKEYERTDDRQGHRNGSYGRQFKTRVGSIMLNVCRDRAGEFQTSLFEKYQRSEKAFVGTIAEMYFSGISTRKIGNIMDELCGFNVSKSQVSNLTAELDPQLLAWKERLLTAVYRYLIFDARYEKIRENGKVVSKAYVVAIGITSEGYREIIGCWVINSESYEAWNECIIALKERGLTGVEYAVADDNKGLRKALQKHFQGLLIQRCQVHYMRNFLSKLAKNERQEGIRLLQDVFAAHTKEEAMERLEKAKTLLESKKKKGVVEWLEESIEEALIVLELPIEHRKKMKSTNMLERFNQELKRRSRVIRIFPNEASCLRVLGTLCQETSESWSHRKYLTMEAS
jgi:putative transposase